MSPSLRPAHVRLPQAKLSRIESPRNARTHSKKQLRQLARSITTFGFTNPVLVGSSGEVIAGHGRFGQRQQTGLWIAVDIGR
jgi:ParB-like chromosome segregation protein Spo0J